MAFRFSRMALVVALASAVSGTAQAQSRPLHFGPRLSYQFDLEELGVGAQLSVPVTRHVEFYPSFDKFFVNAGSYWGVNVDLKYRVATESIDWLYLGGGLNVVKVRRERYHDTRTGLNLFAGVETLQGRVHPFGEFRFTANEGSTTQASVGLNFTMGND